MSKKEPLVWGALTLTSVIIEKYLLPDLFLKHDGSGRSIIDFLGNENIAKGLEIIVNPILGASTIGSAIMNWFPNWYNNFEKEHQTFRNLRRGSSAAAMGLMLTFPVQTYYVAKQVAANFFPKLSPCVGGKKLTLDQIIIEHGPIHRAAVEKLLKMDEYKQLRGNPYLKYPQITLAMESVESSGDICARGTHGEIGLMQPMPKTVSNYGIKDPFNVEQNIGGTLRHFLDLLLVYSKIGLRPDDAMKFAIAAYNSGQPQIDIAIAVSPSRNYADVKKRINSRTTWYVNEVLKRYNKVRGEKSAERKTYNPRQNYVRHAQILPREFKIGYRPHYLAHSRII